MRMALAAALGVFTCLAAPAEADLQRFEYAFTEVCFKPLPDLSRAAVMLAQQGWAGTNGADVGEYEFSDDTTMVFLRLVAPTGGPGCTVMDETVPMKAAEWLLELALQKHFPGQWDKGTDQHNEAIWRLTTGTIITDIHINEGLGGGAAITLEVHE